MKYSLPLKLTYIVIFAIQVNVFLIGFMWYPEIVSRMIQFREMHELAGAGMMMWSLSMTMVVISPVLLLVSPYQIAHAFFRQLSSLTVQPRSTARLA